ncbi:hypothetical protein MMC07_003460 [Pseudocyphellaria aurata]|nr:hypothetical protein [Pseudocyphellaria aurata]
MGAAISASAAIEARAGAPFGLSGGYTQCFTKQASTSTKSIPTKSTAITDTVTLVAVIVVPPVTTITPTKSPASTKRIIVTTVAKTTVSGQISRLTITSVTSSTSTVTAPTLTVTQTSTATVTTTVSGTPVVVPTVSGFLAVDVTLPGAQNLTKREDTLPRALRAPKSYPKSVSCVVVTTVYKTVVFFKTGKTTATVSAPTFTPIVSSTTTSSITSTILKQAAPTTTTVIATINFNTTTTPTTTVTTTTTVSATVSLPAATSYAACARNNLIEAVQGAEIVLAARSGVSDPALSFFTQAKTSYDCCVSCITNSTCAAAAFSTASSTCEMFTDASCASPGAYDFQASFNATSPADAGQVISNGNCGRFSSGVSV